jgi:hypothetical protein
MYFPQPIAFIHFQQSVVQIRRGLGIRYLQSGCEKSTPGHEKIKERYKKSTAPLRSLILILLDLYVKGNWTLISGEIALRKEDQAKKLNEHDRNL